MKESLWKRLTAILVSISITITLIWAASVTADIAAACDASNASFTLRVTVTDGSFAEATFSATVTADNTPPSIACPPTQTAQAGAATYSNPIAIDNCSFTILLCNPPSQSVFPFSSTTVTCGRAGLVAGRFAPRHLLNMQETER
jgi:hypothetical protein